MKALAIDSAATCMVIAAKNDDDKATLSLDISMKQSEKILPAIDFVLQETGLSLAGCRWGTCKCSQVPR